MVYIFIAVPGLRLLPCTPLCTRCLALLQRAMAGRLIEEIDLMMEGMGEDPSGSDSDDDMLGGDGEDDDDDDGLLGGDDDDDEDMEGEESDDEGGEGEDEHGLPHPGGRAADTRGSHTHARSTTCGCGCGCDALFLCYNHCVRVVLMAAGLQAASGEARLCPVSTLV